MALVCMALACGSNDTLVSVDAYGVAAVIACEVDECTIALGSRKPKTTFGVPLTAQAL